MMEGALGGILCEGVDEVEEHTWVPWDPWGGSMDPLGGPMGPWDRWDLGTDGTWASRTPDTSSELFYRYPARLGPARSGPA